MDAVLEMEKLESGYGEVQVLWGVSLQVRPGETHHNHRREWRRQDHDTPHHDG